MTGSLRVSNLVDAAKQQTGLEDLGPDTWQEGLHAFVDSANAEAHYTPFGEDFTGRELVYHLANRLLFEKSWKQHPEIAEERIVAPIIGVGLGRTGSTALSFLLAADPKRRLLRQWEAQTPAPPPEKATELTDPRIAEAARRIKMMYDTFPDYKGLVPLAPDGPTECVYPTAFDFKSMLLESYGKVPSYSEWLFGCDMTSAYDYHHRIHQMLQWHCGPKNWYIRTPCHMHSMKELDARYPDARYVMTHRVITQMIPSEADLFWSLIGPITTDQDPHYQGQHLADVRIECLKRCLAFRDDGNEDRFFDIAFIDMQTDPMTQLTSLYKWLGEELTEEASTGMYAWWDKNSRERQGSRKVDPTTYGVTNEELLERYDFYLKRFPHYTRTTV